MSHKLTNSAWNFRVKRIYLTRIFAEVPQYDARVSQFDLSNFQRKKRSNTEVLSELNDKTIEENG